MGACILQWLRTHQGVTGFIQPMTVTKHLGARGNRGSSCHERYRNVRPLGGTPHNGRWARTDIGRSHRHPLSTSSPSPATSRLAGIVGTLAALQIAGEELSIGEYASGGHS